MATCGQDVGERGLIPTFKMQRGRRYAYFKQRVPSFTDRVLHRSAPGAKACLSLDTFAATPSLVTSARFLTEILDDFRRFVDEI